ncbi:MAG: TIR domain-containing protein, partial [Pseudomonadota bacterium]
MKIFLSWAEADAYIADPIAEILEADGHEVLKVGEDLALEDALGRMSMATDDFDRMIALWSPAYFDSEYSYAEMSAGMERDAMSGGGFLLPVMIETCAPPPPFDKLVAIDLRKFPDDISASGALLRALRGADAAPDSKGAPDKRPSPGGDYSFLEEAFSKVTPEEILAHGDAMTGGGTGRAIPTLAITERPLAEARETYGDAHPEVAQRLLAYAEALYVNGRVEDADAAIREAAAIAETVGELPPHVQGRLVELVEKADRIAERGATSQDGGDAEDDGAPLRETAPYHRDQAATEDLLHRRSVANALGQIIDRVWAEDVSGDDDKSFVIHLHGPWGSGKSSILNFLREKLQSGDVAPPAGTDDHLDPAPR